MTLEKDKVYKVKHLLFRNPSEWTNNIIFSPISDIEIPNNFFDKNCTDIVSPIPDIDTHFTVCFDYKINTKYSLKGSATGIDRNCLILDITNEDYPIIKEAIDELGHGYKYNRKLNKIIQTKCE